MQKVDERAIGLNDTAYVYTYARMYLPAVKQRYLIQRWE